MAKLLSQCSSTAWAGQTGEHKHREFCCGIHFGQEGGIRFGQESSCHLCAKSFNSSLVSVRNERSTNLTFQIKSCTMQQIKVCDLYEETEVCSDLN